MEYAEPFHIFAMTTQAMGNVKSQETGEAPNMPMILFNVPPSAKKELNINAAITSGVIQPATTVKPTNLRTSLFFPRIRDASRNPRHCCPIIPENTRNTIVFFNTVSNLGSLNISIKFLKPTNFIACAELPVSEMSVKEKKTVMTMGPMKKIPSSRIDGEKKSAVFHIFRFC